DRRRHPPRRRTKPAREHRQRLISRHTQPPRNHPMSKRDLQNQMKAVYAEPFTEETHQLNVRLLRRPEAILVWLLGVLFPVVAIGQIDVDWDNVVLHSGGQRLRPIAAPNPPLWGKRFDEGWLDLSEENLIQ